MTWHETHQYYGALRTAVADLDRTDGILVWREEYAAIFGTPHRLRLALRSYWTTMVCAQVEYLWDNGGRSADAARDLIEAHPGLVRALTAADLDWVQDAPPVNDGEMVGAA